MPRSFVRRRAVLGFILSLACTLIWHDTPARSQSAPPAALDLFGPCSAPTFGTAVPSYRRGPYSSEDLLAALPADFDEDGRPDLAVITGDGRDPLANNRGSVEVWKGQARGAFSFGFSIVWPIRTDTLDTADINGDGHSDVLYTVPASRTLVAHLGDGAGAVGPGSSHPLECIASDIAVHEIDGDTTADVVVSCADVDPLAARGSVLVLPGDGAGGFGTPVTVALDARPGALAVADLNLDTHADAVVADPAGNGVWVLLGNASGDFAVSAHLAVGQKPRDVQVADVDADGIPDIVTANELSHDVSVLIGLGNGGFALQQAFPAGDTPLSLAIADVNGDGDPDLAVTDEAAKAIAVLLGDAGGSFGMPTLVPVGHSPWDWGPVSVAVADLTADARPDLVSANGQYGSVAALLNLCDVANADVSVVSIVADPDPVPFKELVTDTVVIANNGPDVALGVTLRVLPSAEFVSLSASQGSCGPDVSGWARCTLGDLAAGATATAWLVQRATNTYSVGFSLEIASDTLDPDLDNNSRFFDSGVLAVGGLDVGLSQLPLSYGPAVINFTWSPGALQTGYVVGRWANGAITTLPPRLDATAHAYWDRNPVPGTYNCYFVVPLDDAGSLGHSSTLCIVPNSGWHDETVPRIDIDLGMSEPNANTVHLHWQGIGSNAAKVIWAQPLVEGAPARWTVFTGEEQDLLDDTGGVTTCYVVFHPGPDSTVHGYSNMMCAVPGSTVAPRGTATTWSAPMIPAGLRPGAARLRTAVEQTRAWLASRR